MFTLHSEFFSGGAKVYQCLAINQVSCHHGGRKQMRMVPTKTNLPSFSEVLQNVTKNINHRH